MSAATALRLHPNEAEVVAAEAEHYASRVGNPETRLAYERLREGAEAGELADDLVPVLGQLLELGLGTGRIRSAYGPHAEMAVRGLFRRTPRGRELSRQASEVNEALEQLRGGALEKVSVQTSGPGRYLLTLETDEARVVVSLDGHGASVKSLEVSF